ncbi:hypothetical protein D3C75_1058270 [compost metagenome]
MTSVPIHFALLLYKLLRAPDNGLRNTQLFGNLKGITFACFPNRQPVQRLQSVLVKLHPRILEPAGRSCKNLKLIKMGGHYDICAFTVQFLKYGNG